MREIVFIAAFAFLAFFSIGAFICAHAANKARKQAEKKLNEVCEYETKAVEIIEDAVKTKADARTGDHSADIKYMADKLHDYANK